MSLFLLQLRGELWKLFARKRTYMGFGVFLGVEFLVLLLSQLPLGRRWFQRVIESNGGVFGDYFSGLTLAAIMVGMTILLLGALFLALVGGDIVAKEVEDGTMRMTLCRPITRIRVLVIKYVACVINTFVLIIFIALTALAAATLVRGNGSLLILVPEERLVAFFPFAEGLTRYLCAMPLLALSLLTITTFSFHLSCWNIKPAAATIAAITLVFVDWILHFVPYFEPYRPWMMTAHMNTWLGIYRTPIPWEKMVEDYSWLFGLNASFLIVGAVIFCSRDFKS